MMPPERQILGLTAIGDELKQLVKGPYIGYGERHTAVVPHRRSLRQPDNQRQDDIYHRPGYGGDFCPEDRCHVLVGEAGRA